MEETTFKKDETPYLIFECSKCRQFMYVRTTQKGKKCLRCGCTHVVSRILDSGEIVNGMTAAVDEVKNRQNGFAVSELGHSPEFRAFTDFKVSLNRPDITHFKDDTSDPDQDDEYSDRFTRMLKEISLIYDEFPSYVIEVMADNYMIPHFQLKFLKKQFESKGILKKLSNDSYKVIL